MKIDEVFKLDWITIYTIEYEEGDCKINQKEGYE